MTDTPRCFYCGENTYSLPRNKRHTIDHIYPKTLLRKLRQFNLQPSWYVLNTASCCSDCNVMKGRLHPLDWLVIMPNDAQAKKLAERLVALGEDMAEVFDAYRRRKKR